MKQLLNTQYFFIGIDVSKLTIDVSVIHNNDNEHQYECFSNNAKGFNSFKHWLLKIPGLQFNHCLCCMEHTGIYTRQLTNFLLSVDINVWMESPLQIKRSIGMTRGKNDKIDSYRIAYYAFTHHLNAKLLQPGNPSVLLMKDLLASRDRVLKCIQAIKIPIQELMKIDKQSAKDLAILNQSALKGLLKSKLLIETKIRSVIENDERLNRIFNLVTSVKGVGFVLASQLLIYTHQFTRMNNAKQLACYCGVAPFAHTSGTSIKGKAGTSNFANMNLKSTLHLAALSSCKNVPDLKCYYERKIAEGKPKMTIINAVRNKILQRIIAVVKRGTPYQLNYKI